MLRILCNGAYSINSFSFLTLQKWEIIPFFFLANAFVHYIYTEREWSARKIKLRSSTDYVLKYLKYMSKCNQKSEDLSFLWIASKLNTFKIIFCYFIARILNTTITITVLQLADFRTATFKCRPGKNLCSLNYSIISYL